MIHRSEPLETTHGAGICRLNDRSGLRLARTSRRGNKSVQSRQLSLTPRNTVKWRNAAPTCGFESGCAPQHIRQSSSKTNSSISLPSASRKLPLQRNGHQQLLCERKRMNIARRNAADASVDGHDALPQPHQADRQADELSVQASSPVRLSADQVDKTSYMVCIRFTKHRILLSNHRVRRMRRCRKPITIQPHHLSTRAPSLPQR